MRVAGALLVARSLGLQPQQRHSSALSAVEVSAEVETLVKCDVGCSALDRLEIGGPTVWSEFGDLARQLEQTFDIPASRD